MRYPHGGRTPGKEIRYTECIHTNMFFALNVRAVSTFLGITLLFICASLGSTPAHAQFGTLGGGSIAVKPQYPLAGDVVSLTFKTNTVDMSVSQVTWRINGEVVAQGYGQRTHSFVAGVPGESFAIEVTAVPPKGAVVRASEIIRISDLSFAWEARTYTPPLFQGKSLLTRGAEATVVVFPTVYDNAGKLYDPSVLSYEWMLDGNNVLDVSGRGKSSAVLKTQQLFDKFGITVTVKDPLGTVRIKKYFALPITEPRIIFYEDNPMLGILYNRALKDSGSLAGEELKIVAEPYYASAQSRLDPLLEYKWNIGKDTMNTPGSLVLRTEGSGVGVANLSLSVVNSNFIAQRMQERLQISFGQSSDRRFNAPTEAP